MLTVPPAVLVLQWNLTGAAIVLHELKCEKMVKLRLFQSMLQMAMEISHVATQI